MNRHTLSAILAASSALATANADASQTAFFGASCQINPGDDADTFHHLISDDDDLAAGTARWTSIPSPSPEATQHTLPDAPLHRNVICPIVSELDAPPASSIGANVYLSQPLPSGLTCTFFAFNSILQTVWVGYGTTPTTHGAHWIQSSGAGAPSSAVYYSVSCAVPPGASVEGYIIYQ